VNLSKRSAEAAADKAEASTDEVPGGIMPGQDLRFLYRSTLCTSEVQRNNHPGDETEVDVLQPGHEWWRGLRKG
jgi:hypothetical protein